MQNIRDKNVYNISDIINREQIIIKKNNNHIQINMVKQSNLVSRKTSANKITSNKIYKQKISST